MARVSLFYTVAGSRSLFQCRALALLPTTIQTNGQYLRSQASRGVGLGLATGTGTAAAAAAKASPAWRKGSHLRNVLVTPDGVEQPQPQQHEHDGQLQPDGRAEDGVTAEDGAAAATAERKENLNRVRKFRPDSKRILRIPEEEWPRCAGDDNRKIRQENDGFLGGDQN